MIFELPNFVSKEELDFINIKINSHTDLLETKQNSYRDGGTLSISNNEKFLELDKFLHNVFSSKKLIGFIQRRYRPVYSSGDSGYEFHRYSPGDICNVHGDGEMSYFSSAEQGEQSLIRFLSVVLHLNTPTNGGELVFPELNKTIKTEAGKIVLFPPYNFVQHYTNPSTDSRDVIVTWFVYDKIRAVIV